MDPLGDVRHPLLVLHVERSDPHPVLVGDPVGVRPVRPETVAARMEDDDVGQGQRALGHRRQRPPRPSHPPSTAESARGLSAAYIVVQRRRCPRRCTDGSWTSVLALLACRLAFGVDDHTRATTTTSARWFMRTCRRTIGSSTAPRTRTASPGPTRCPESVQRVARIDRAGTTPTTCPTRTHGCPGSGNRRSRQRVAADGRLRTAAIICGAIGSPTASTAPYSWSAKSGLSSP